MVSHFNGLPTTSICRIIRCRLSHFTSNLLPSSDKLRSAMPLLKSVKITTPTGAGAGTSNQQPRQPATPSQNAWASQTKTAHLKSALTAGRNPTNAGSQYRPNRKSVVNPSAMANEFSQMTIGNSGPNPNAMVYNPSMGPSPSVMTDNWKQYSNAPSQSNQSTFRQQVNNTVCRISKRTREHFKLGDVIALPFHAPNSNPNVDPNTDNRWVWTVEGPAYSKRRMMVVMWKHKRDMFCLPLYSFGGRGIKSKEDYLLHEYVAVKNVGDNNFVNAGKYAPVEVKCHKKDLTAETTVWITGGMKVACNEDIAYVGRATRKGYAHLLELWQGLNESALQEAYVD